MFIVEKLYYIIISLHLISAASQINLYYTDLVSESSENLSGLQHDCLRVTYIGPTLMTKNREIYPFCMSEPSSKFSIETNNRLPKFTFTQLWQQNITSEQLYRWSAPIDIIERYQFYLNQLSSTNDLSLGQELFYNCTLPWFGSMCQYQFDYYHPKHTSLQHIIRDFYYNNLYVPTNLTCYEHLLCQRESYFGCLDWSEICDGFIHCLNGGIDEEHCWELEINECKENEYRCMDGQCIPILSSSNEIIDFDCLDGSALDKLNHEDRSYCFYGQPSIECEDRRCSNSIVTGSCMYQRFTFLLQTWFSIKEKNTSDHCWLAIKCSLKVPDLNCRSFCEDIYCFEIIEQECPNIIYIPAFPILFGNIYFAFINNRSISYIHEAGRYIHVCSNSSLYDDYFDDNKKVSFDGVTCYQSNVWHVLLMNDKLQQLQLFSFDNAKIFKYNPFSNLSSEICKRSNAYQCINSSKCISIHRLADLVWDCPNLDDEDVNVLNNVVLTEYFSRNRFRCPISNRSILIPYVDKNGCNCGQTVEGVCEFDYMREHDENAIILFKEICDTVTSLKPISIQGRNETDETACEHWPCNSAYTRCNGKWHCPKGEDEAGCDLLSPANCSSNDHICVSPYTQQLICLPIEKVNDGNIDCVGAFDERKLCGEFTIGVVHYKTKRFYCDDGHSKVCISPGQICDGHYDCIDGEDEKFCEQEPYPVLGLIQRMCEPPYTSVRSSIIQIICEGLGMRQLLLDKEITLDNLAYSEEYSIDQSDNFISLPSEIIKIPRTEWSPCHRGLELRVQLDSKTNLSTLTCLCPPSYYGDRCQYQNQRISLTLQIRGSLDTWQTAFAILVLLISDNNNNERIIHSSEQFTYLSMRDCESKFFMYLLYATRPKNQTNSYAIQIDIYEKASLNYRGSFLIPVQFSFLPVHRLRYVIDIPRYNIEVNYCSNLRCKHGKCVRYMDKVDVSFCQCIQGWTGRYCTIPYSSRCSSDSLSIDVTVHNQPICVCRLYRFGSRCLLFNTICQTEANSTCKNGGRCVPPDEFAMSVQKPSCLCPRGFRGDRCEIADNQVILSFEKDIVVPQSIFIHFIGISQEPSPSRATTFKMIPIKQDSLIIYWSQPFHLVFIELFPKHYYLTVIQKTYNRSNKINKMISSSDRCPHISKIFNESFAQVHLLHRIKFYHLPCQQNSSGLKCFYDDIHLCFCYDHDRHHRLANCFKFDHNMKFNCSGQNHCQNDAQCFQDTLACSRRTICVCAQCFYGSQCQFSTNGFGLSLDAILGYHISPHLNIFYQSSIIRTSLALTIIFILAGFIDGIISLITFHNKIICEVGCGLYLLSSSITTLLTMTIFGLKFGILILAQMSVIKNRSFLSIQCYSIDMILRICLYMNQWLHAFVAIERATTTIKGARFSKKKSKKIAKLVIRIILILTIATNIHDPLHRRLIHEKQNDDDDEIRTWCIVTYSSKLQTYSYIVHILHFIVPFLCNLIASIILITKKSEQQTHIRSNQTFKQLLQQQFFEHKRLFIGPFILVILAIPHLIISFISKCMKSANESWLFLMTYFISFIPSILNSLIFIFPSKFYKVQLRMTMNRYQTNIQRRLQFTT